MNMLNSKILKETKSPFIIDVDFESILAPEDNGKQNSNESYTNKYQKHVACSHRYIDDKFNKVFKSYLSKDAVYNFISSIIDESRYCGNVMKNHSNKELVMSKEDNEDFENSAKCRICDNDYVNNDFKERDHC